MTLPEKEKIIIAGDHNFHIGRGRREKASVEDSASAREQTC